MSGCGPEPTPVPTLLDVGKRMTSGHEPLTRPLLEGNRPCRGRLPSSLLTTADSVPALNRCVASIAIERFGHMMHGAITIAKVIETVCPVTLRDLFRSVFR